MAELDLHEQEQVDAFRAWWKENGNRVIAVVVLAALAFAASQWWRSYQAGQAAQAATLYGEVMQQVESRDAKRIGDAADALANRFGGSAYAPRAQLLAAQASLQAGDEARAKVQLLWVIEHADETALLQAARLKLASVLLDQGQYDAALQQLANPHPAPFASLYADLKGDVLRAAGKKAEARAAYQLALDKLDAQSSYRSLVQLKLDGLGKAQ